jgi:hypothetical protein
MSTDIKSIQIAGARPKDLIMKGRRRSRKQAGGGDEAPLSTATGQIAISKLNSDPAPVIPLPNPAPADSKAYHIIEAGRMKGGSMPPPAQSASSKSNIPPGPELSATTKVITGGVILKSKKRTAKVLLKKKEAIPAAPSAASTPASGKPKRHATRKVVLKSLSKRLKKTRHAVKQAQVVPIEKIRAALIEKKLIKPTSKAPESVLRQIYADSIIVAKKTL